MHIRKPRYEKELFGKMGKDWYEKKIRALVEEGNFGRIVAIDIETGDYELGDDPLDACKPLIARSPDVQIFCIRIGHIAVEKFGGINTREKK